MGNVRYYDCLNCKEYDTVSLECKLTSEGLNVMVSKCTYCGQFHTLDKEDNLIKYVEDGKE